MAAYDIKTMEVGAYRPLNLKVAVIDCNGMEKEDTPPAAMSRDDVIRELSMRRPKEKRPDIIPASDNNRCSECGAIGTELIRCSSCGRLVCPDCAYDDMHDGSKTYCPECYDKIEAIVFVK